MKSYGNQSINQSIQFTSKESERQLVEFKMPECAVVMVSPSLLSLPPSATVMAHLGRKLAVSHDPAAANHPSVAVR